MRNWKDSAVKRRLGLAAPIIQGPFGGGLSSVELTATVSENGGLGSFGVHNLSAAQIQQTAQAIRSQTDKPFALNLWLPYADSEAPDISDDRFAQAQALFAPYFAELGQTAQLASRPARFAPAFDEQMEAVLAARPRAFSFVYGVPSAAILSRCRELDIVTLGTATTVEEAQALDAAGVDMIIGTGFEAGGHRPSFIRSAEDSLHGLFALIPPMVDAVRAPVIAAGGIADGRGFAAALALGAQAVQIGTAFLACEQSGASRLQKDMLFSADARHTSLSKAFTGRLARGIENRLSRELQGQDAAFLPYPAQGWLTGQLKQLAVAHNQPGLMSMWSSQAASLLKHRDAATLLAALVDEVEAGFA